MDDYFFNGDTYFKIDGYDFEEETGIVKFRYSQHGGIFGTKPLKFCEEVYFIKPDQDRLKTVKQSFEWDLQLHYALALATFVIGTSYYKVRPTETVLTDNLFWYDDTTLFDYAYQEGLSQFAYENSLTRKDLGKVFVDEVAMVSRAMPGPRPFDGKGILALQSGGKDSILTATLLNEKKLPWTALYISSNENTYPEVIDQLGAKKIQVIKRKIDKKHVSEAAKLGGLNGHVPVTYINMALALVQAILNGDNKILTSIGHEGEEPHAIIKSPAGSGLKDLPVNHQWSKTWEAEQLFAKFVAEYISKDIKIGSPLRQYSELKIAELFAEKCWDKYGDKFSSCNQANYAQGADNTKLYWCGKCAKCANSYLLFAPFVEPKKLNSIIKNNTGSLFSDPDMTTIFKGLLDIDDEMKPFECVGEIAELRRAYHMKQPDYPNLPFDVPKSDYNYEQTYLYQDLGL